MGKWIEGVDLCLWELPVDSEFVLVHPLVYERAGDVFVVRSQSTFDCRSINTTMALNKRTGETHLFPFQRIVRLLADAVAVKLTGDWKDVTW